MCILGVLLDDHVKVSDRVVMIVDHLVGLRTLVNISDIGWNALNASGVREDRLLELLQATVGQANVIEDVSLVGHEWIIFQCLLQRLDAQLVPVSGKVSKAELVKHLGVVLVNVKSIQ